jgi:hypothetical protein
MTTANGRGQVLEWDLRVLTAKHAELQGRQVLPALPPALLPALLPRQGGAAPAAGASFSMGKRGLVTIYNLPFTIYHCGAARE